MGHQGGTPSPVPRTPASAPLTTGGTQREGEGPLRPRRVKGAKERDSRTGRAPGRRAPDQPLPALSGKARSCSRQRGPGFAPPAPGRAARLREHPRACTRTCPCTHTMRVPVRGSPLPASIPPGLPIPARPERTRGAQALTCGGLWALRGRGLLGRPGGLPRRLAGLSRLPWGRGRSVRWRRGATPSHHPREAFLGYREDRCFLAVTERAPGACPPRQSGVAPWGAARGRR